MNPTAAANQKPLWHSMPSTRWAFGLLGFPTAFSNTVLKNAVREVSKDVRSRQLHSIPGVALGLTSMIGITMFGNTLRSGGKNLEEIEAGDRDISDEVKDAAIRAGLLGPTESIVRTKDTLAYENFITAVTKRFTGPAVDDIINLTKGYEGLLTFAVSKIPGIAILRSTNPEAYKEIRAAAREVDITRRGKKPQEEEVLGRPLIPHYAKGGVVKDVPQVPEEPDERIDKMTGLPYNVQAGKAFIDEEDSEKRERLAIGGPLSRIILKKIRASLQDPILPGPKPGEAPGPRVSKSTTTEVAEEATEEIAEEATEAATSAAGKDVARLQVAEEATEAATSAADKRVWIEDHVEKLALLYLPGLLYLNSREREEALDSISEMPLKEKLEIISDESIKEDLERLLQATEEIEKPPYPEGEDPTAYRWTGEGWVRKSDTGWLGPRRHITGATMTEFSIGNIDNPLDPDDPLRPSMVPTLTEEEIEFLTTLPAGMSPREWGEHPLGKSVLEKSWDHYKMRSEQGLSPFLTPEEEKEREGYQEGSLVEDPSPAGKDLERLQATEEIEESRILSVIRKDRGPEVADVLKEHGRMVGEIESNSMPNRVQGSSTDDPTQGTGVGRGKYQYEMAHPDNPTAQQGALTAVNRYKKFLKVNGIEPTEEDKRLFDDDNPDFSLLSESLQDDILYADKALGSLPLDDLASGVLSQKDAWLDGHWKGAPEERAIKEAMWDERFPATQEGN